MEPLPERGLDADDRDVVRSQRAKLESLLAPAVGTAESDPRTTAAMSDEDLVNALAQYLGLEPLEKQALIEQESLRRRARVARRTARDEDHDGAHARALERRALISFQLSALSLQTVSRDRLAAEF